MTRYKVIVKTNENIVEIEFDTKIQAIDYAVSYIRKHKGEDYTISTKEIK